MSSPAIDAGIRQGSLFSVIIPTYHRNDLLSRCLDHLVSGAQTLLFERYEVIVTDDGESSTAETMIRERYPWAKWSAGPRKGPATNRNNGAKLASGQWLVFLDDDCSPDMDWLESFDRAVCAHPSIRVFEGRVYADRPRRSLAEKCPGNDRGGYLWACNFCIERSLFNSMGGFEESFPFAAMEDVELRLRLTQKGHRFLFLNNAAVSHPWRKMNGWTELKRHQYSTLLYLSLHPEESSNLNSTYYLRCAAVTTFRQLIPGIIKYSGAGLTTALQEIFSILQMAVYLLRSVRVSKLGGNHARL